MAYRVKVEGFEGPFDLLLHLISRRKVDVYDISVAMIADEYLAYLDKMTELDLDVASEFLLVAATLLEIKAAGLFPSEAEPVLDDELSPAETRDVLVARLLEYKKFKNAALELAARLDAVAKLHPREAGLEPQFAQLLPDFLENVTLDQIALVLTSLLVVSDVEVVDISHVASLPISLDERIRELAETINAARTTTFGALIADSDTITVFVATFLALLELYKRGEIQLQQQETFGEITVWPRNRKAS